MTSLAFTLMPFVYFGVRALRRATRAARLAGCVACGSASRPRPARRRAAAAAGQRLVHVHREGRRGLGDARERLAHAADARRHRARRRRRRARRCAGVGDRALLAARSRCSPAICSRSMVGGHARDRRCAAELDAASARVSRATSCPCCRSLLLSRRGRASVALIAVPRAPLRAAAVAVAGRVALWSARARCPRSRYVPNQFTGHLRFQFDYDDAHNPYVHAGAARSGAGVLPRARARSRRGSLTLIEAPWRLESHFNPHVVVPAVHRQNVMIGLMTPVCGVRNFGEYPETTAGHAARQLRAPVERAARQDYGADFLVMHLTPWSTPPGAECRGPMSRLPAGDRGARSGRPFYRDDADRRVRAQARRPSGVADPAALTSARTAARARRASASSAAARCVLASSRVAEPARAARPARACVRQSSSSARLASK